MLKDIANAKEKLCSIELSSRRNFDLDILNGLKFSFASVIWIGKYEKDPQVIEPLVLARALIQRGFTVVLHIPARCFTTQAHANKCLTYAKKIGVRNLLVVRGGGPEAVDVASSFPFPYSVDMINYIKKKFGDCFEIAVAGYPLLHPETETMEDEMNCMKAKYEAGARYIVTQSIFSYTVIRDYLDNLKRHDIKVKVIPGLYIMSSFTDYILLQRLCKIPNDDEMAVFVSENKGDDEALYKYGRETAKNMVNSILNDKEFLPPHLFTMNEFDVVKIFIQSLYN